VVSALSVLVTVSAVTVPEMQHGWVPRGDLSIPEVERDVKKALDLALAYFKKHL
jgi:hypothetical protein